MTEDTPTASLPITIRIIHTKLNGLQELDATQIASEAVTGCDTVEEALTAISEHIASTTVSITALVPIANSMLKKAGNVCTLYIEMVSSNLPANGLIATIPSGFRPSQNITFAGASTKDTNYTEVYTSYCTISSDGNVTIKKGASAGVVTTFLVTYVL